MVEIFGRIRENRVQGNTRQTTFIVPAFSQRSARLRALGNARAKGYSNREVVSLEREGDGSLPGQGIYEVVVSSRSS